MIKSQNELLVGQFSQGSFLEIQVKMRKQYDRN